jgi:hypothetical protein
LIDPLRAGGTAEHKRHHHIPAHGKNTAFQQLRRLLPAW